MTAICGQRRNAGTAVCTKVNANQTRVSNRLSATMGPLFPGTVNNTANLPQTVSRRNKCGINLLADTTIFG